LELARRATDTRRRQSPATLPWSERGDRLVDAVEYDNNAPWLLDSYLDFSFYSTAGSTLSDFTISPLGGAPASVGFDSDGVDNDH